MRFGRWQQIAGLEFTGDPAFMPVSHAIHHQARAVALAALGRHDEADMAAADFDAARARLPAGYAYFNNQADDILSVGAAMMRGEIAYHAGETEAGFDWLREACAAEDRLVYTKPRAGDAGAALAAALPLADQPVTSSCFCRGSAGGSGMA